MKRATGASARMQINSSKKALTSQNYMWHRVDVKTLKGGKASAQMAFFIGANSPNILWVNYSLRLPVAARAGAPSFGALTSLRLFFAQKLSKSKGDQK